MPRLCIFLRLTHDEVTIFVNALESMRAGFHAEVTLEIMEVSDPAALLFDRPKILLRMHARRSIRYSCL